MNPLGKLWYGISATYRVIIAVALVLFAVLIIWYFGAKAWNRIDRWWYNKEVRELQQQNDALKQERETLKAEWQKLRGEYEASKEETARIRAERENLEKILADKTVTTDAKLKAFKKTLAEPVPVSAPDVTDTELCLRANRLGLPCAN